MEESLKTEMATRERRSILEDGKQQITEFYKEYRE